MTEHRTPEGKLQFANGYAEIRGDDLFIAVDGYCLAMPLAQWMHRGWSFNDHREPSANERESMQDAVIHDLHSRNEQLRKECSDLREIALMVSRKLR